MVTKSYSSFYCPLPFSSWDPHGLSLPELPTIAAPPLFVSLSTLSETQNKPHGKVPGPWGLSGERMHSLEQRLMTFKHSSCFCCQSGEIGEAGDKDIGHINTQICICGNKIHAMGHSWRHTYTNTHSIIRGHRFSDILHIIRADWLLGLAVKASMI